MSFNIDEFHFKSANWTSSGTNGVLFTSSSPSMIRIRNLPVDIGSLSTLELPFVLVPLYQEMPYCCIVPSKNRISRNFFTNKSEKVGLE